MSISLGVVTNALAAVAVLVCVLWVAAPASAEVTYPFLGQITGATTPAGGFTRLDPAGVAVDHAAGRIYVANRANPNEQLFHAGVVYVFDLAGEYLETWVGTPTEVFSEPCAISVNEKTGEVYVAVNNRGYGDVIDVFGPMGEYRSTWTGGSTPGGEFGSGVLGSIAVDQDSGDVYIAAHGNQAVYVLSSTGEYLYQLAARETPTKEFQAFRSFAVDGADQRVYLATSTPGGESAIEVFDTSGRYMETWEETPDRNIQGSAGIGVDEATGDIYVAYTYVDSVAVLNALGQQQGEIEDGLSYPQSVAVDQSNGEVYVSDGSQSPLLDIFGPNPVTLPTPSTGSPSDLQPTSVTIGGTVDPAGQSLTTCKFEYIVEEAYERGFKEAFANPYAGGHTVPCVESAGEIGAGTEPVAVHADLSSLPLSTGYEFRLVVANANGISYAKQGTAFTTSGPPAILEQYVSEVGFTSAVVNAELAPHGLATTYRVEYGASQAYGQDSGTLEIPPAAGTTHVSLTLTGLQPGAAVHFRFLAENAVSSLAGEPVEGSDIQFDTFPTSVDAGLPDGRVYEMVTPVENYDAEVYPPDGNGQLAAEIETQLPIQAAASGEAIAYVGEPGPEGSGEAGNLNRGNEYLATRTAGGWSQRDISPLGHDTVAYQAFSPDLSVGVLRGEREVAPVLAEAPAGYEMLYTRDDLSGTERALFTSFAGATPPTSSVSDRFAGASEDFSTLLFESSAALVNGAPEGAGTDNLYETHDGKLELVNQLPEGNGVEPDASFGASNAEENASFGVASVNGSGPPDVDHDISADGSRVFWTGLHSHGLYMSRAGGETVQIDLANKKKGSAAVATGSSGTRAPTVNACSSPTHAS